MLSHSISSNPSINILTFLAQVRLGKQRHFEKVFQVAISQPFLLSAHIQQLAGCVLANGFQHIVARGVSGSIANQEHE